MKILDRSACWPTLLAALGLLTGQPGQVAAAEAATEKPSLLVLQTKVTGVQSGVDPVALTNLAGTLIADLGRYQVISAEDIGSMLDQEQQKQLSGCDDTSCMAEIGAAMGARFLYYSNVGKVGGKLVTTASLIDTGEGTVVERKSVVAPAPEQVVDALEVVTRRLFGLEATMPPPPGSEPALDYGTWKWVTLGVGLAVAAVGGLGTGMAVSSAADADAADSQAKIDDARDAGDTWNIVAVAGYAVGGAVLATAIVFFILDATSGPDAGDAAAVVAPLPGGGVAVQAAWRF